MIDVIQENIGKILKVKIFSIYNYGDDVEAKINDFIAKYNNAIYDIIPLGNKNGRLLILYYDKLGDKDYESI